MNEEVVRELEPFYEEICRNSKRFTKTNEDAPNYIDVDKVLELVNKYDAINKKQLEQRDNIINKATELLGEYTHYTSPDEIQNSKNDDIAYKTYKILRTLNINKGDE